MEPFQVSCLVRCPDFSTPTGSTLLHVHKCIIWGSNNCPFYRSVALNIAQMHHLGLQQLSLLSKCPCFGASWFHTKHEVSVVHAMTNTRSEFFEVG